MENNNMINGYHFLKSTKNEIILFDKFSGLDAKLH